jgi:pimeloyl-ACP methyl ester carboxylesterase
MVVGYRTMNRTSSILALSIATFLVAACVTPPQDHWASTVTSRLPESRDTAEGIILIAHGTGSGADEWPVWYEDRIRPLPDAERWDIVRLNWSSLSDRYFSAAASGLQLGRLLGNELAERVDRYRVIHLIGQSMGAHVVQGIAESYRAATEHREDQAIIHMTFLDPFMPMGIFRLFYGRSRFGLFADFAECYFTRDEPVWFTNTPLEHAVNFDLTHLVPPRERPWFTYYHDYPLIFYRDSIRLDAPGPGFPLSPFALGALDAGSAYDVAVLNEVLPPGHVVVVE